EGEPEAFDAVASHFFLDCFRADQLAQIAGRVAAWTRPGARWLVTDFCVPERGWRRWRARAIHRLMYAAFRITVNLAASQLTPPDPFLSAAGFALRSRQHANFGLLHSDVWVRGGG
ncbi:MAG: class I SAM-dependent methyltransferase, partial [Vicinamibacterales bacterium]